MSGAGCKFEFCQFSTSLLLTFNQSTSIQTDPDYSFNTGIFVTKAYRTQKFISIAPYL